MRTLLLLLLLLAPLPSRGEPASAVRPPDPQMLADAMGTAYAFIAPRSLAPVAVPQMALWALGGLAALDPALSTELQEGSLRLIAARRLLLAREAPGVEDARAWGQVTADLARAAWDASGRLRDAGAQAMVSAMFAELTGHLDPYSRYIPPAEAEADRMRRTGSAGIGVRVGERAGGFVLEQVEPSGPAAASGLRAGERLLAVDGQSVQDADVDTITGMLIGPEGTPVTLTLRNAAGRQHEVTLLRTLAPPLSVRAERRGDVLVLRIGLFAGDTGVRLAALLLDGMAAANPPHGLLIDLRGNRGGLLHQAVAAAETLLADGVIATTAGRDPAAAHAFVAHGTDLAGGLPAVVMVDGRSASAAEILAAALADQHRAVVLGSVTLGKGLVQTIAGLPDGGELLISWSRVLAPLGWPIQALGVLPQVCTSLGTETAMRQIAELRRGEQPMARALARHRAERAPVSATEALEARSVCPAAEGGPLDTTAAQALLHDPAAYNAALLGPPATRANAARAASATQ
jgi:carboxyl-terminal processing protease